MDRETSLPIVQLSEYEREVYNYLFQLADQDGDGYIGPQDASFFHKCHLSRDHLAKIWDMVSNGGSKLNRNSFFASMRMIVLLQQGRMASSFNDILQQIEWPIPAIDGVQLPTPWVITSQFRAYSDEIFNSVHKSQPYYISGEEAKDFLVKSGLDYLTLASIWELSDIDRDGKLSKDEFCVAMYLVHAKTSGKALPKALPPSLLNSYRRQPQSDGKAEDLKLGGDECFQKGDFDGAEMYYNAAIEKTFVQLASCFRHRASVKFAKSNIEDAIKDCGEALKYDPKYSKAFLQRSICYLQRGDFKEAQDDINKAMEVDPMDSQIQQHMQRVTAVIQSKQTAEAAKKKKSWTEAFEAYKIVASICCSSVQMQLEFAEMALQTNNAKEASAAVRVLMEREPGNSEALWMQAQIKYQLAADLSEVMESLKAVLKIDPNHNGASELKKKIEKSKQLRQKGNEAFQAKNYEEAVATYSELLADEDKKAPNAQNCVIYANRGLAHKQLNNFDKAVEDLSTAIERNSNYVKAYIRRAECYMAIQLWEEADRDYASLCALEPFNNDYIAKRQMIQQKINEQKSRNYYEVMGLPPFAPLPDVKKAYRLLALRYHPDKVASSGISPLKAAHLFKEIQFCNEILSDPQKKEQYDKELHFQQNQRSWANPNTFTQTQSTPNPYHHQNPTYATSGF